MLRTVDVGAWQLRWDRTGLAVFFGVDHLWTVQIHWWKRPRFVVRHDHSTFSFPRYRWSR